jgi:hypothetical protein
MLQMGFGLPSVAGPAESTAPEGLGIGGFYAGSRGIGRREPRSLFPLLPRCPQGQFCLTRVQGQGTCGGSGARLVERTGPAIGPSEVDRNHLMFSPGPTVIAGLPAHTGVALRTNGLLRLPIDLELVAREFLPGAGLLAKIAAGRTDDLNLEPPLGRS